MRIKFIFFSLLLMNSMFAQQDAQYTQYMYNTFNVNPAYAGSRGVMSVMLLHRSQWIGIEGAPVVNSVSVSSPIANSRFGFGVSVLNDRIGISDENTLSSDVSYTVPTSERYKLSFGIKATVNLLNVDFNKLTVRPGDVPTIGQYNINNRFTPNIGAGIYFHSNETYVGLSVPHFLETKRYNDERTSVATERMHFYFIAGKVFDLSESLRFKPALLTKMVQGAPLQVDLSGNFLIHEKFTIGAAYRWDVAVSALAGFQISDSWLIGYGYDMETTKLRNYSSGSHEIFLRYEFFRTGGKIISPRFF